MTAPEASKCQVSVGNSTESFGATGGSAVVTVSAARECGWTATANAPWISIRGAATGQGDGSVSYSVAPNQVPSPRSGTLAVASATVQLSQAAAPCVFTLNRVRDTVPASGGQRVVSVSTLNGCAWTAVSVDSWIAVTTGQNGSGSGSVTLTAAINPGAARVGRASIAGQSFTLSQDGMVPSDPPPPPSPPPAKVHLEGAVTLLLGRCPDLQFLVVATPVVTDGSTDYRKKGKCEDVRVGVSVSVDGVQEAAAVRAQTIEFKPND